jgi:FG-GAP repeat
VLDTCGLSKNQFYYRPKGSKPGRKPSQHTLQAVNGEAAGDLSGNSVSLSSDSTRVAIGAPGNNGNGTISGHVRVYEESGGSWTQIGSDIDGEAWGDISGVFVSLSSDGTRVAIGAPRNDGNGTKSGHVRVYEENEGN